MPGRKMLILRGNSAAAGTYPDEKGENIAWPFGALHVSAASEYARQSGYEPIVLDVPGQPQSEKSPQATAALKKFLEDPDQAVTAFYGFSGGGYNLWHILQHLATNNPEALHRIRLVVVLGAPLRHESEYDPVKYNLLAKRTLKKRKDPAEWRPVRWDVVWRTNPPKSALPKDVSRDTETHMFSPEALLAERPAGIGRYRDWPVDDDC
jgi:hypothetical protein